MLLLLSTMPLGAFAVGGSTDITATVKHERTMTILPHPHGELLYVAPLGLYAGDTVEFTPVPDEGYALKSIVWYTTDPASATDITAAKKFTMPDADVTVKAEFTKKSSGGSGGRLPSDTMPFVDVAKNAYYCEAVKWAVKNDITKGTDATHFSPDIGITRAQVVTFLWRTAGCPEPKGDASKFVDVERGSYYEKAVAWAIEQIVTKGTSPTTFSPDVVCTRAHIVTFLARFSGVADEATGYKHGFTDVKATDYFHNAVAWAKDNKVTKGTSATTFSPNDNCTRAQVVTFLYRWMVRK